MKKKLLASILSIVMCLSVMAGSTYAIFTSESTINVAVTSGTVSVVAVPEIDKDKTSMYYGSASIENGKVVIDKIMPKDTVTVNVAIDNLSNVPAKYRTVVKCIEDNPLTRELVIKLDGKEFSESAESKWYTLEPNVDGKTVEVVVHLPESASESNGGITCTLLVTVEAVQGNATTYDPLPPVDVIKMSQEEKKIVPDGTNVVVQGIDAPLNIESGLTFKAVETSLDVQQSQYADWIVDYELSFDKDIVYVYANEDEDIPSIRGDLFLIGEYQAFSEWNHHDDLWIPLPVLFPGMGDIEGIDEVIENGQRTITLKAGTKLRVMKDLLAKMEYMVKFDYQMIVDSIKEFKCGIVTDVAGVGLCDENTIARFTGVELTLCLYETVDGNEKENGAKFEVSRFEDSLNSKLEISGESNEAKADALKEELKNVTTKEATIYAEAQELVWKTGAEIGSTPIIDEKADTKTLTFDGGDNGATFTAIGSGVGAIANRTENGKLIFKNVKFVDQSVSYAENNWEYAYLEFAGDVEFYNCEFESAIMMETTNAKFVNCTFNSNKENEYDVWVSDGNATFIDCKFLGFRGLKIHEAYGSEVDVVTVDSCEFGPLSIKPGIAIGDLNADTTVLIRFSKFINCQAGDQGLFVYESDTDVTTFNFINENNIIKNN